MISKLICIVRTFITLESNMESVSVSQIVQSLREKYAEYLRKSLSPKYLDDRMHEVDKVSTDLIELQNVKSVLNKLVPVRNTGGGNCFYKSVSIALQGNEILSTMLRLLVSIELFDNTEYYIDQCV